MMPRYFRVLMIYEKHYNKWFIIKSNSKKWKKKSKPYKLEIRIIEKNKLDESSDVALNDPNCTKSEICKNIRDQNILEVVRKTGTSLK